MGVLGWFNGVGEIGWVIWACPTACTCLFILRLVVLRRPLSHIWCKLNFPIFLFNVGLLSAGSQSQAGRVSIQPERSTGNAGAQPQAGSVSTQAGSTGSAGTQAQAGSISSPIVSTGSAGAQPQADSISS